MAPLLFAEAATAAWILHEGGGPAFRLSAWLIPAIWLSTALLQAPIHTRLMKGFDAALVRRLIITNWIRTVAWTARGILVSLTLMNHHLLLALFTVGSLSHAQTNVKLAPPSI